MKNKIIVFLLTICLAAGHFIPVTFAGGNVYADTDSDAAVSAEQTEPAVQTEEEEEAEEPAADDDGMWWRLNGEGSQIENFYGMSTFSTSIRVNHNSRFDGYNIYKGIDVSKHNGTINWTKVAADDIDFAIIRMAYRGYASSGKIVTDPQAYANLKGAQAAGLDVGVYFFSQAITKAEAVEEAKYILKLIEGYDIDLPVVMDFEYTGGSAGRLTAAKLTDRQRTDICLAFCNTIEAAGYDSMVYANKSMLTNDLYAKEIAAKSEIWLAEWTSAAAYKGDYTYWQYTSSGSVSGVPSARVDMNYRYEKPGVDVTARSNHSISLDWTEVEDAEGYYVYRKTASGEYEKVGETAESSYKDEGLAFGTTYTYKIAGYSTADGVITEFDSGLTERKTSTTATLSKTTLSGKALNAGEIQLTWNPVTDAEGYVLQRYNSSKKAYVTVATIKGGDTTSYKHTGRVIGTTYKYRIRPYTKANGSTVYGSYSAVKSIKTLTTLGSTPLTATPSTYTSVKLTWNKVPGAKGYKIQRYNASTKKYVTIKTVTSSTSTVFTNTYLNCDTTYKYRIRPYATLSGKTVYGSYSAAVSATTLESVTGKVTTSKLNVRTGPSTKYKKLTAVYKGNELTVTGSRSGWYRVKVKVKGVYKTGYVSKSYVKLQ